MNILVTGASGFVGTSLIPFLLEKGHSVTAQIRSRDKLASAYSKKKDKEINDNSDAGINPEEKKTTDDNENPWNLNLSESKIRLFESGDITPQTDWTGALKNIDVVIHLAQRAHVMEERETDPLSVYRKINVDSMKNLLGQCVDANVKRFIFISSIKVNGEFTFNNPFSEVSQPAPEDPYGISKLEAENLLKEICSRSKMDYVIIRPPLIYGPDVPANFKSLIRIVQKGIPLPFGGIKNQRSMIGISNLIDFILFAAVKPEAAGNIFLISDGEDLSLPGLIQKIAAANSQKPPLFYFPVIILKILFFLISGNRLSRRLISSLQIDSSKAKTLGWNPPHTVDFDIRRAVESMSS